jgi:plastocyanin
VNQDGVDHTVTSTGGLFDSGNLESGDDFEYRFDTAGTFPYFCTLHPSMTGEVVVVEQTPDAYLPIILR